MPMIHMKRIPTFLSLLFALSFAPLETPGADKHGPDANEVRKLRELHERWTKKPGQAKSKASATAARPKSKRG